MIYRICTTEDILCKEVISISKPKNLDIFHYLTNIIKIRKSEKVIFFKKNIQADFLFTVVNINNKSIELHLVEKINKQDELLPISTIIPYIKNDKMITLMKQAVEYGCRTIYITQMQHSIKITTQEKIMQYALDALEQSNGNLMCEIYFENSLKAALDKNQQNVLLYGAVNKVPSANVKFFSKKEQEITTVVGPEGGFSAEEKELLRLHNNAKAVTIGNRILRCETAHAALLTTAFHSSNNNLMTFLE